ncbi:MAG: type I secretion C-terminal target domain-containing protein [Cyanobacteria bacterium CRU_2_1]|nr:type I secretion C-terminal target domain-containing protein [Cyanobacteria bacterium CRU_2_1]
MGYANNSSEAGLLGGYLGVGVDEFGNFSNPTEGRVGGPGQKADSIAIRGSQATNYKYLAGTNTLPTSIDNNSGGANRSNSQRKILIEITPSGLLSVQVDLNNDGDYTDPGEPAINLADITAVNGALPNTFKFGFASSTGGSHNIHEVRNLEITTYNDPPAVADASVTVSTGTTLNLTGLTATDSNGTVTSFTITSLPDAADGVLYFGDPATGGTLVTAGQVFTPAQIGQIYFQATAGFNGGSFTYTATDDEGKSDPTPATVTLALNGTPTTNVATVTVSASTTVNLTGLSGTDPDGSVTAYTITSLPTPADGTLYLGNPASGGTAVTLGQSIPAASIGNLYFQATVNFNGGSFTYAATDNSGITDPTPATVSLNIPPVADNAAVNITANATVKLSGLSATDLDNRVQTYTLSTLPIAAQGTLYLGNPASGGTPVTAGQILTTDQIVQLYFQAEAGFSGATFTYTATDEAGGTDPTPATVTLTKITNAPPTANNIAATVKPGNTLNLPALSASDSDGNSSVIYYTIASLPDPADGVLYLNDPASGGTPVVAGQTFEASQINKLFFQATAGFDGGSFTYTVADNKGAADSTPATVTLNVPGVMITPTGGSTEVAEGGATDTYSVVLASAPTADVTITLATDGQTSTNAPTLTFTSANWNVPQTVTVTAVDDAVVEGTHPATITHTATSTDPNYNGIAIAPVPITITDNDIAGVNLSTPNLTTGENGTTATFDVVLNSQPTADVTITLVNGDPTEGTLSTTMLTFTAANWNQPQVVTVTGVDDLTVDGNIVYTIGTTATSSDPNYNDIAVPDVTVTNADNDIAGVIITPSGGGTNSAEGGASDTYTVQLASQPTAPVTITINNDGQTGTNVTTLTFDASNWNIPQTVTVSAVDDATAEGTHPGTITHTATSTDPNYNGSAIAPVPVTLTDNDSAGVSLSNTTLTTSEDGTNASFQVALTSQPTDPVTITLTNGDPTEGSLSTTTLTFTSANWNQPQTVTVTGIDDPTVDGDVPYTIDVSASSTDTRYDTLEPLSIAVTNTDNDTAGVTISNTTLITSENGSTASFEVVLTSAPTAEVTITLGNGDPSEGTLSTTTLTFTAANWNQPQTVSVTGVDDPIVDGDVLYTIDTTATSTDPNYNTITVPDITITNTDNDIAGIVITSSGGSTDLTEGGASDTYTVVLTSQPIAPVTITINNGGQTSTGVTTLTFDATNWNQPQTVTVTAVDDPVVEGLHTDTITHTVTSTDPNYNGISVAPVTATITDNDIPSISITPANLFTTEAGGTATFDVTLTSQPASDVTITLVNSDPTEGTLSTTTIVFTPANWNQPQTVTVTGVDDVVDDGDISYTIGGTATSTDPNYDNITAPDVTITNIDNDGVGVTITPNNLTTGENGTIAGFSLVLDSAPSADVTVTLTNGDPTEGTLSTTTIVFTPANWNQPQTVTVTGVDDPTIDGNISYTIATAITSPDPSYDNIAVADLIITNTDNDIAGISITSTNLPTSENGTTASFAVVLNTAPTADVTLTLTNGDPTEGTLNTTMLTFTTANWNQPQTVTVSGLDDAIVDGNIPYTITTSVSSNDPNYNTIAVPAITVTNTDNDIPATNNPPATTDGAISVNPNAITQLIGLGATDPDGDPIQSYTLSSLPPADQGTLYLGDPTKGGIPITNGQILSPADINNLFFKTTPGFNGGISFQYTATDSKDVTDPTPAIVSLNLATSPSIPTNTSPTTLDVTNSTLIHPDTAVPISGLNAVDPDGSIAYFTITSLPPADHGVLYLGDPMNGGIAIAAGQTLTPDQLSQLFFRASNTFVGDTRFTYTATDNLGATDLSAATIVLASANRGDGCYEKPYQHQVGVFRKGRNRKEKLQGTNGSDRIFGRNGNDVLRGEGDDDRLSGGLGNDRLNGQTGRDSLTGGMGNDRIRGGSSPDILRGGRGKDRLWGGTSADRLFGDRENDQLFGQECHDTLRGGIGNDKLNGGTGNDRLSGNQGKDRLWGGNGNDTLGGGLQNDQLGGARGNDRLNGGKGRDRLWGGADHDILNGGMGNDTLKGGNGNDRVNGNQGKDRLWGGNGNDVLGGGLQNDRLGGGRGNDRLSGGKGRDRLWGGADYDTLNGGLNRDTLKGGGGSDTLRGGLDRDTLQGGGGNDRAFGGRGNDFLGGGEGTDTLNGGLNHDRLVGWAGQDFLRGGAGNDFLDGGGKRDRDADTLLGGLGKDTLVGGFGADVLAGGYGRDRFVYRKAGEGGDVITDFESRDVIDVSRILASRKFAGSKSLRNLKVTQIGSDTLIQIDTNGKVSGGLQPLATLENVAASTLKSTHFIFT